MSVLCIVDLGHGNLRSVYKAFERVAKDSSVKVIMTSDYKEVSKADKIVLPGVGAFRTCRSDLDKIPGMQEALTEAVIQKKRLFLGICIGMQFLADTGEEDGETSGLRWISGRVARLNQESLIVPHMGWNTLNDVAENKALFRGVQEGDHVYFAHSYHFKPRDMKDVLAFTDYGGAVVAAIGRENIYGIQFHPEKSQGCGMKVLRNFLEMVE